ncbi:uncharacterized protein LOC110973590 isoform X2 [Acanthaster planci]|uniref:Uncharacterized protein LOC110973590 isoform X2 n=1 Tax=Acanthaster planci TaxID=133434 RepID=A0A8B7XJR5_ACAPL|nr:uncharacterized protein LOC110973590 isoform X2 [Acanthaster planci]
MGDLDLLVSKMAKAEKIIADQAQQLNKLECFSCRNNLRIIGLPQKPGEGCLALSKKLLSDKFDMADVKMERAHRDGPKSDGKLQHLLMKLNCYQDKISILRRQRHAAKAYQEGIKYLFVMAGWTKWEADA